eukprot:1275144-Pyramimonas_sp.AAC.1
MSLTHTSVAKTPFPLRSRRTGDRVGKGVDVTAHSLINANLQRRNRTASSPMYLDMISTLSASNA